METFKVGDLVKLTGFDWDGSGLEKNGIYPVNKVQGDGWALIQGGWCVDPAPDEAYSGHVVDKYDFEASVSSIVNEVRDTLIAKNKAYGNSALEPVRVFSTADPVEQLRVRIDDKLSRLKSSLNDDNEDTVLDLMGYLVLLRIATRKQDDNG